MKYDSHKHHRRSIRLPEYDYTQPGTYFVTICTQGREPIFGQIQNGVMLLSPAGIIAREEWFKTAALRPNVRLEEAEFVVMPNHVHGIIWIVGDENTGEHELARVWVGAQRRCAPTMVTPTHKPIHPNAPQNATPPEINVPANSLGAIVRAYKSAVTYRINALNETRRAPVWQRNYYEHILRDEAEWGRITKYIQNNPLCWEQDQLHTR